MEVVNTRWLQSDEYDKLKGLWDSDKWIPGTDHSHVVVAENDEGKVIGFWAVQVLIHTEPVWLDKAYKGQGITNRLWDMVKELVGDRNLFAATADSHIERCLKWMGFKNKGTLYMKEGK